MRRNKYIFVLIMLLAIAMAGGIFTKAYVKLEDKTGREEGLRIVTSFYPIYIAAENVIGHNHDVVLENLSEPQTGCMHDYQLTPHDMILLSQADVFIVNGGGIESFLSEIAKTYPDLTVINATEGLEMMEDNAHAWLNTELYAEMVENIADGLSKLDNKHEKDYKENSRLYCGEIDKLTEQIVEIRERTSGENTVIFHEAYEYVAQQYHMNVTYCLDLDEERQVSAGEMAEVMEQIYHNDTSVILAEELYGKDMGNTVEKESKCRVYYLDSLVRGTYEKDSYLTAMQKNIDLMKEVAGKE